MTRQMKNTCSHDTDLLAMQISITERMVKHYYRRGDRDAVSYYRAILDDLKARATDGEA